VTKEGIMITKMLLLAIIASLMSCATKNTNVDKDESVGQVGQARHAPNVGDPCTPQDGYQIPPFDIPNDGSAPVGIVPSGVIDYHQLPPGTAYCMAPGGKYPHGYFTMNCSVDADCTAGSVCDGTRCRAPCTKHSDCRKPTVCWPDSDAGAPRFCQRSPDDDDNSAGAASSEHGRRHNGDGQ
jgi:hypothetical protein